MNNLQKYHNMEFKTQTLNQLKALRQPGQKNLTKTSILPNFFTVIATYTASDHTVKIFLKLYA